MLRNAALLLALAPGASAFVDGRTANKFFSKQVFAPGQLEGLAKLIPDDSTPSLRTCYERVVLDERLASIWGADAGCPVPAAAQVGGFCEHHDTNLGEKEFVAATVKILYLEASNDAHFVLIDEETKEEFKALIEPGLVVEYDNLRYAHRIDGSDSTTRKFLGPAAYGSDLGLIGADKSDWTAGTLVACDGLLKVPCETPATVGEVKNCEWDADALCPEVTRRNLRFGYPDEPDTCPKCKPLEM